MHSIETETVIDAAREKIWQILSDFSSYPEWNPFITEIRGELKTGARVRVTLTIKGRKPAALMPELTVVIPGEKLCWRGRLYFKGLFDAIHYFNLEETKNGKTRFVHGEIFRGILVRYIIRRIGKSTQEAFEGMNAALKQRAERTGPAGKEDPGN